jgi:hypothetical protein
VAQVAEKIGSKSSKFKVQNARFLGLKPEFKDFLYALCGFAREKLQ